MQPCYCLAKGNSFYALAFPEFSTQASLTPYHRIDISVFQQNSPRLIWIVLAGWSAKPTLLTPDNSN